MASPLSLAPCSTSAALLLMAAVSGCATAGQGPTGQGALGLGETDDDPSEPGSGIDDSGSPGSAPDCWATTRSPETEGDDKAGDLIVAIVPDARGEASRKREEAHATASMRVSQSQSDIVRFEALSATHGDAPRATRLELQVQALQAIWNAVEVVVARPGTELVLWALVPPEAP